MKKVRDLFEKALFQMREKATSSKEKEFEDIQTISEQIKSMPTFKADMITPEMYNFHSRGWLSMSLNEKLLRLNKKVGIFGTGLSSNLIPMLLKECIYNVVFADGDDVELQNNSRQNFHKKDIGKNKAQALFENYSTEYPSSNLVPIPYFLEEWSLNLLLNDSHFDYIINAIDFDNPAYLTSHQLSLKQAQYEFFPFVMDTYGVVIVNKKGSGSDFTKELNSSDPEDLKMKIVTHCLEEMKKTLSPPRMKRLQKNVDVYKCFHQFHPSDPQVNTPVMKACTLILDIIIDDIKNTFSPEDELVEIDIFPKIYFR